MVKIINNKLWFGIRRKIIITNEQIGAINSGELNPDTLWANFQVKPAPTGD
jgi:hypothetical protein